MNRVLLCLLLLSAIALGSSENSNEEIEADEGYFEYLFGDEENHTVAIHTAHGVQLASWKFDYVKEPLILTFFIILIGIFKLLYHHSRWIQKIVPESCCLIVLGAILGTAFLGNTDNVKFLEFDSRTFFFFLLPPIILESAYSLKDRAFIENLGTICLYAVVGTILNIIIIGGGLIFLWWIGFMGSFEVAPLDCLLFAALIAAVDPVAVLAIFQEVGVNKVLYFMVFGESLLNDAVTVVCYTLVNEFEELPHVTIGDVILGFFSFCCVSLGGIVIGAIFGLLSAVITRFTEHVRVVEPVMLFGFAYLSYMFAELFHWSGIIAILVCGLVQAHYSCGNISSKSFISVTYSAKVLSSVSESLIFIILGVMLVNENAWFWDDWHPAFAAWALVLCLVARTAVVFFLTYIANRFTGGVRYIAFKEQLIMSYGGLRGAVSFSLAFMIKDTVATKSTLLAATYVVIIFTVFVQGCTIKPLVRYLNIRLAGKDDKMRLFIEFNSGMIVHLSQGLEDLCGYKDTSFMVRSSKLSRKYVRPVLEKNYSSKRRPEEKLLEMDRVVTMSENLRKVSSLSSFKQQQEIEKLAEEGAITMECLDNEETLLQESELKRRESTGSERGKRGIPRITKEYLEKQTDELIKDAQHIRQLIMNPFDNYYHNRNLVAEEEFEEEARKSHLRMLQQRARAIGGSETRKRTGLLRGTAKKKKQSLNQGLILASMGTIGVQSLNNDEERKLSTIQEHLDTANVSSGADE